MIPRDLKNASSEVKKSFSLVCMIVSTHPTQLAYAELTENEFATIVLSEFALFQCLKTELKNDYNFVKKILSFQTMEQTSIYRFLSDSLKANAELADISLRFDGLSIKYMPDKFKDDIKYAFKAIARNRRAYLYLNDVMQNDLRIINELLNTPEAIEHISMKTLTLHKDYFTNFLEQLPHATEHVNINFISDDKSLILKLLKYDNIYSGLDDKYKYDEDVIYNYLVNYGAYRLPKEINIYFKTIATKEFTIKCYKAKSVPEFDYLQDVFKEDFELVMLYIGSSRKIMSVSLQQYIKTLTDEEKIIKMIQANTYTYPYVNEQLLNYRDIIKRAMSNRFVCDYIGESSNNLELVLFACKKNPKISFMKSMEEHKELLIYKLARENFRDIPDKYLSDKEFILKCLKCNGAERCNILQQIKYDLRFDFEFVYNVLCIKNDGKLYSRYLSTPEVDRYTTKHCVKLKDALFQLSSTVKLGRIAQKMRSQHNGLDIMFHYEKTENNFV